MAQETDAAKIVRLNKALNQWKQKKIIAKELAQHYYSSAYKQGGVIPESTKLHEGATFGWFAGTYPLASEAEKRGRVKNSPSFQNTFYPDGKLHGPISIDGYTNLLYIYYWDTYTFNRIKTDPIDPNNLFSAALGNKDARARHAYMQNQYKVVIPAAMREIEQQLNALGVSDNELGGSSGGDEDTGGGGPSRPGRRRRRRRRNRRRRQKNNFDTNVGMVAEAYFRQDAGFAKLANLMTGGSLPHDVDNASRLWKDAQSNKGMIWLYVPKNPAKDTYTLVPTAAAGKEEYVQYVFQFHYNPPTIQMAWTGNPEIDVTMESSGTEKFNNMSSSTTSAISFDIILNRMYDFQYYGTDGVLKDGYRTGDSGHPYIAKSPETNEQKAIYNKGTMYDVEYLLGTALGFKLRTRLRKKTTDIGYLTGRPVDLHLGNNLRYWGYITSISLEHRIFDERMVPIFSTLHIDFARVPDYGGKNK